VALGSLVLGNLAGLWALLAVPVLLVIHLLQQKARRMEISTLFLLARIAPEASQGRRIDRLRSSLPLWLQLLAIVALSWVLVEPHFVESRSVQRAVLVLDSSASMAVFRERMIAEVDRISAELEKSAARTEWIVIDSDVAKRTLYSGAQRSEAMDAVRAFSADGGAHDFAPALAVALGLARGRGPVLLVSDHEVQVAGGVELLAVGEAIDNVGFTGLTVARADGGVQWTAMIENHGRAAATRTFRIDEGEPRKLALDPGELRTLRGSFPEGADRARLVLSADRFPLDDTIPMVRPRPKLLRVFVDPKLQELEVVQRLVAGLEAAASIADPRGADLVITAAEVPAPEAKRISSPIDDAPEANAILFRIDDAPEQTNELAPILAERGALTEGLAWQGLLRRKSAPLVVSAEDAPVLWQGEHPLVMLRKAGSRQQLVIGFDPRHSNVDRLPSFAILLLRFVESIRAGKAELEAKNLETRQPLQLALAGEEQVVLRTEHAEERFDPREARSLIAPAEPGFFFVQQGKLMLLAGAARFGDLREADLSRAKSATPSLGMMRELALRNSRPDPLRPLWILVAGGACLGAWFFAGRKR
jgi:hypothetical protein